MKKLSISISKALKIYSFDRICEICKKSGFDAIDYNLEYLYPLEQGIYAASDVKFEEHFYNVHKTAEKYDLEIGQTHGRGETYDPVDQTRRE